MAWWRCLVVLGLMVVAGCGGRARVIQAADYDQSCSVDADCIVLHTGDPCGCSCATDGINAAERPRVQEDLAAIECRHGGQPLCEPCAAVEAYCDTGRCKSRPRTL